MIISDVLILCEPPHISPILHIILVSVTLKIYIILVFVSIIENYQFSEAIKMTMDII